MTFTFLNKMLSLFFNLQLITLIYFIKDNPIKGTNKKELERQYFSLDPRKTNFYSLKTLLKHKFY